MSSSLAPRDSGAGRGGLQSVLSATTLIGAAQRVVRPRRTALCAETGGVGDWATLTHSWTLEDSNAMRWLSDVRRWTDLVAYRALCQIDRIRRRRPFRLATVRCSTFPQATSIGDRSLYVTEFRRLRKWASFRCPGGCGKIVRLQLTRPQSPSWTARTDWLGRTTLSPSVRQLTACGCHFWVRKGCIDWCNDTPVSIRRSNSTSSSANR